MLIRILVILLRFTPFEVTVYVRLTFRNGRTYVFTCDEFEAWELGDDLQRLKASKARGWPHYVRLADISYVTSARGLRFRRG